jgi:hypothetical protein
MENDMTVYQLSNRKGKIIAVYTNREEAKWAWKHLPNGYFLTQREAGEFEKLGAIYRKEQLQIASQMLHKAHDYLLTQTSFTDKFPYEDSVREAMTILMGQFYRIKAELRNC